MKILVLNGPNLNMLGKRDEKNYGTKTYKDLNKLIQDYTNKNSITVEVFQSNLEGEIINKLHVAYNDKVDGIVVNLGAYSHYSIAIRDALEIFEIPIIEVHISNIYSREEFRHKSIISAICLGQITGLGIYGYILALEKIKEIYKFQ